MKVLDLQDFHSLRKARQSLFLEKGQESTNPSGEKPLLQPQNATIFDSL